MDINIYIADYSNTLAWMDENIYKLQKIIKIASAVYNVNYTDMIQPVGDEDFTLLYRVIFKDGTIFCIAGEYGESVCDGERYINCMKNDLILYEVNCSYHESFSTMFDGLNSVFEKFTYTILSYMEYLAPPTAGKFSLKAGE
jgi:hypothetical protein